MELGIGLSVYFATLGRDGSSMLDGRSLACIHAVSLAVEK
jgi:hypothetical protein